MSVRDSPLARPSCRIPILQWGRCHIRRHSPSILSRPQIFRSPAYSIDVAAPAAYNAGMPLLPRIISVCALVLLQVASANGHILHHALEGAVPEHHDCTDMTCGMNQGQDQDRDQNPAAACHHSPDTNLPPQHDCDDCFLCDASDAQFARATRQYRPLEDTTAVYPLTGVAQSDASSDQARRLPPPLPPPRPATLHAVTLPLLD